MRHSIMLGLTLAAFAPAAVHAQSCLGLPSYNKVPTQLRASLMTGNDVTNLGGALSWGSPGPFASVSAGFVDFDGIDENAVTLGFDVGYQVTSSGVSRPRPSDSRQAPSHAGINTRWCPMGSFEYQVGPEFDFFGESIDLSAWTLSGGAMLGLPLAGATNLQLIPTGGAALAYTKVSTDAGPYGSGSSSETYGIISLGLGLLMNETLGVRPLIRFPIGLEGADPILAITVSWVMGGR